MAGTDDRKVVVVDGSNLATEGRTTPSLHQLDEAVRAYANEDPDAEIVVVVDASFEHRIDPSERSQLLEAERHGEVVSPPAGAIGRGDAFVLRIAERTGARVLSNDSFQEFHAEHPWLFDEGRLVGGKPVPGVGWIFTPRIPVRGPKSRGAAGKAGKSKGPAAEDLSPPLKAAELAKAAKKAAEKKVSAKKAPVMPDGSAPNVGDVWPEAAVVTGSKEPVANKRKGKQPTAGEGGPSRGGLQPVGGETRSGKRATQAKKEPEKKVERAKKAEKAPAKKTEQPKKTAATKAKEKERVEEPKRVAEKAKAAKETPAKGAPAKKAVPAKKAAAQTVAGKVAAAKVTSSAKKQPAAKKAATKTAAATRKAAPVRARTGTSGAVIGPARTRTSGDPVLQAAIGQAMAEVLAPPTEVAAPPGKSGTKKAKEDGKARRRRRRSVAPPPAVNEPLAFINFVATYPLQSEVEGEVVSFTSHGAMVDVALPDGGVLHCYIPLTAMGSPPPTKARQVLSRGERRRFVLAGLDPPRRVAELALPSSS